MINFLTDKILNFTVSNNDELRQMENEMIDVYRYGIEITLSTILNIFLILLAAIIQGNIISGLLFLFCFVPLRFFTGGYHAKSYLKCNIVFVLVFLAVCLLSNLLYQNFTLKIVELTLLVGFLPIYIFSPVENKNKPLNEAKKKKCKIIACVVYSILSVLSAGMLQLNKLFGTIMLFTLLAIVGMIIVEILLKRSVKNDS